MPGEASRTQDVEEVVVLRDFAQSLLEIGIPLLLLDLLQVHQDEVGVVCLIMANRDFLVLVGLVLDHVSKKLAQPEFAEAVHEVIYFGSLN